MNTRSDQHSSVRSGRSFQPVSVLAGLVFLGAGFGFVEAAVVVDLRAVLESVSQKTGRISSDEVFPMFTLKELDGVDPVAGRLMRIEVCREAATLVLLAGAGLATGRNFLQRFAAFSIGFGVWDLCYYLALRLFLGWPASMWTWDVLFLIPVPWAAPVVAPVVVATSMVVAGSIVILWESGGLVFRMRRSHWAAIVTGGLILLAAFCWDSSNLAAGGAPSAFPWSIFAAGELLACVAFLHACWMNKSALSPVVAPSSDRETSAFAAAQVD
jgi:hypothetical protein